MADRNTNVNDLPNPKTWTEEEQRLIDANAMDSDVFADRIFEQLEAAPAFISMEQLDFN